MLKLKLTPLCIALCLTGGVVSSASAQSESTDQQRKIDQLIKKVNARTAELESEIRALKAQVSELKKQNVKQDRNIQQVAQQKGIKAYGPDVLQTGVMPVTTGPYVADIGSGLSLAPDGLAIMLSSYNLDLGLLKQQLQMDKAFTELTGNTKPPHSLVQLSGRVEAQLWAGRNTNSTRSSDIDLTSAELDLTSRAGNWVTAFMAFAYDGAAATGTTTRIANSRLFVDKAFITIGNLNESPVYGTIGQKHVAFGQYANPFVTRPFTRDLGRTKARQISVSYQHPGNSGLYATAFGFRGDSRMSQNINQAGGSVGYEYKNKEKNWGVNVGVDYITNIADSEGIQRSLTNLRTPATANQLTTRVPAVAVHGKLDIGPYALIAEYIGAVRAFSPINVSINNVGAKPRALHIAGVYKYTGLWNRPSEVALGYNYARDTQAFGIPQSRWNITHSMVILKNTIFGLEYRRDKNYNASDRAFLQGTRVNANTLGGFTNTITAQLTYLF